MMKERGLRGFQRHRSYVRVSLAPPYDADESIRRQAVERIRTELPDAPLRFWMRRDGLGRLTIIGQWR